MLHFRMMRWTFLLGTLMLATTCISQEITATDSCWTLLQKASLANDFGEYDYALRLYDSSLLKCKSKLALTEANTGKARSLNGLKRYPEAISKAESALILANNASIAAVFEKANANFASNNEAAGKKDYSLLEQRLKNSSKPKEKAFILSKLARLNWTQKNLLPVQKQITKAISLDPGNAAYQLLLGDYNCFEKKIPEAMANYDKAATNHANEQLVAWKKASAYTVSMQEKYHVHDAKELKFKLRIDEKLTFCEHWKAAFNTGYSNKQAELYFTFVCQ